MEIAGDERLCCNAAACADHFNRETFVAMIAFLNSDKLIHELPVTAATEKRTFSSATATPSIAVATETNPMSARARNLEVNITR